MDRGLLDDEVLALSSVVANNAMNRERQLAGVNSYARELGFDPLAWVRERVGRDRSGVDGAVVGWLDLCCGSGRALSQAAELLERDGLADRVVLMGVDLVDYFDPSPASGAAVRLLVGSVARWSPSQPFDLITCVHGLHYVGDKLGVLCRAAGWLTRDGLFVGDVDLGSVRLAGGQPAGRALLTAVRAAGFSYDSRRRRIRCAGRREVSLPYRYLGADDRAGANYTGQPAVDSYYALR